MAYYLGIDLGTTYTAAAAEHEGVVEALTLGNRTASVPSVVFLRDDGEILVGEAATRRATSDPGRVAREFKRRVGDPTPIILGGTPYGAEMLMARLLRWSVDRVREQQGEPPRAIALTHPANWGPYKLDLLSQAVRQVDVDAALLLAEPVAAATFYASQRRLEDGSVVAVYDLGGGTFDAAMVRRTPGGFQIIGSPEGIERLGGIDFDEAVYAHVRSAVGDALDRLDPEEPAAQAAVARLRQECIDAKEALSSDTDVSIPVLLPGLQTEVRLTRSEFEAMIRPAIAETIVALSRAIRSAGVASDDISAVLLVGGSSRIPLVAQMVGAELGRPIAIDAHPKDAIAFGAAIAVAAQRGAATPESVTTVLADNRPPPPTVSSEARARSARPAPPRPAGGLQDTRPAPPRPSPPRPSPPGGGLRPPTPTGPAGGVAAAGAAGPAGAAAGAGPAPGRDARPAPPAAAAGAAAAARDARPAPPTPGGAAATPGGVGSGGSAAAPGARSGAGTATPPDSATPPGSAGEPGSAGAPGSATPPGSASAPGSAGWPGSAGARGSATTPGPAGQRPAGVTGAPAGPPRPTAPGGADRTLAPGASTPGQSPVPGQSPTAGQSPIPGRSPVVGQSPTPGQPGPASRSAAGSSFGSPAPPPRPAPPTPSPGTGRAVGGPPTPHGGMPRAGGVGATPSGGHAVPLGGIPSGGHPLPPTPPSGSGNRGVWVAVACIAAVAILLAAIIATSGGGDGGGGDGGEADGYTPEIEEEFVSSCQEAAGDTGLSESQCQCAFDEIEANVPFERFVEIDEQLREGSTDIPEELTDVMGTCLSGG